MQIKNLRRVERNKSNRLGLLVFSGLGLVTLIFIVLAQDRAMMPLLKEANAAPETLQLSGKLSQHKLVQGEHNIVYLNVAIKSPAITPITTASTATDMIIVLDRSGSMSGTKKMPYAKAAMRDVLSRLNGNDRFSLVSFSDHAIVHSPFVVVSPDNRNKLFNMIESINANGGTNMSDGLNSALGLLVNNSTDRTRRVLLLSDGQANQGIAHIEGLSSIASAMTGRSAVLSTIGMGLDFNEVLMTQLADHGMGQYAYLEDLSGLGQVLAGDLRDSRNIYASGSMLDINPSDGVKILDAGGYPLQHINASTVRITTGQILSNSEKQFVLTLSVPNQHVGTFNIGKVILNYQRQGESNQVFMHDDYMVLSVVEPKRKNEALSSINADIYKQNWVKNNLGRMQKKLSRFLREGKKDQAEQVIYNYRASVARAEKESNVSIASPEMNEALNVMQDNVEEVFSGSRMDQEVKRKRAAKSIQSEAIQAQRNVRN